MNRDNPYALPEPREIIRQLREKKGFTSDRALAIAAGINQPTLSRYLSGATDSMAIDNFRALAEVLDATVSELLGEVPIGAGGRVREVLRLLEALPEPEQQALLAAGKAMASVLKKSS